MSTKSGWKNEVVQMKIYIDKDYKCHVANDGTMIEIETNFFDNKCGAFIEGYRFIPINEIWIREDGEIFAGEMIAPWKNYSELDAIQRAYEIEQLQDMKNALNELGVNI